MDRENVSVISIDLGTSSVRAVLFAANLNNIFQAQWKVELITDTQGKAEQDAGEIKNAALKCLSDVLAFAKMKNLTPLGVCFSNAVSSLVCLDETFSPIGPALTYADLRAHEEADQLRQAHAWQTFSYSACPVHASYWLPKLLWLKEHGESHYFENKFCTIKDYIVHAMTGQFVTDESNLIATGMGDVRIKNWDDQLLEIGGINKNQVPIVKSTTSILDFSEDFDDIDIPDGLKIILGATDGVLSSLGSGAYGHSQVTTMIGSSGACRIAADNPIYGEENTITWSYPLDDEIWICGGAMNSGGMVTEWFVKNFIDSEEQSPENAFEKMLQLAENVPAGSEGLIFLPYIFGERAPIWNAEARGVYLGVHERHTRAHFARATIEGVLMALYSIFQSVTGENREDVEIRATGGFVRSDLMLQSQADIFGLPVSVPENYEGSAMGAAILAMKSLGLINDYTEIDHFIRIDRVVEPFAENQSIYKEIFTRFREAYNRIAPLFR